MKLKNYLEKRAFDLAFPTNPKPETAKMLNYFNSAVKNKGYDVKPHSVHYLDAPSPAAGYSDSSKRDMIVTPASAFGPLTHEVGHIYSGHTRIPHMDILRQVPIVGDITTLATEAQANAKSWKMLKDVYGDDKKLLDTIKKDRWDTVPYAYGSYILNNGLPLATTAAGTYLGYRHYNKLKKNIDNKRNNILNDNNLSKEQRDELLKKLKDPSKAFELFRGGVWGYAGGKLLGMAVGYPLYNKTMANKVLKKSEDYNTNAGTIDLMREHAKRNGYYTPELDTDTRGIYN